MLIPGCGKGYDIALFAAHGYDAYGLEVSQHAVQIAQKYIQDPGKGPLEEEYVVQNEQVGKGGTKVLLGDYFDNGWLKEVQGWDGDEGFDIIYDNTVRLYFIIDSGLLTKKTSSFVLSHLVCGPNGRREQWNCCVATKMRKALQMTIPMTVCSYVSSSQPTSLLPRVVRRGRCLQLCTQSC